MDREGYIKQNPKAYLAPAAEKQLIKKTAAGDNDAFEKLYLAFFNSLYGFLVGRVGGAAPDLCQEVFFRAFKKIKEGKYNYSYKFFTFLRMIGKNSVSEYYSPRPQQTDNIFISRSKDEESKVPDVKNKIFLQKLQRDIFHQIEKRLAAETVPEPVVEVEPQGLLTAEELPDLGPPPDIVVDRLHLLRLLTGCCAKPHMMVAVFFSKILEWKPAEIGKELGDKTLGELKAKFIRDYTLCLDGLLQPVTLEEHCEGLNGKLGQTMAELYTELEYEKLLKDAGPRRVSELLFKIFFTADPPNENISDWCYKVKNRARKMVLPGKESPDSTNSPGS